MDRSLKDLTGRKFGKWVVLPRDGFEANFQFLVQCECGRLRLVAGNELVNGRPPSCGCEPRRKNGATGKTSAHDNGKKSVHDNEKKSVKTNGKTSVHGSALRTRLQRVLNQLRPKGKGSGDKSEGAWESGLIDETTQSDFWFD